MSRKINYGDYKAVVFDLGSTVFMENRTKALKFLNKSNLLRYTAIGRSPTELHKRSNELLEKRYGYGINHPKLVEDFLSGKYTSQEALQMYDTMMVDVDHSKHTKQLLYDVGKITFTPEILVC